MNARVAVTVTPTAVPAARERFAAGPAATARLATSPPAAVSPGRLAPSRMPLAMRLRRLPMHALNSPTTALSLLLGNAPDLPTTRVACAATYLVASAAKTSRRHVIPTTPGRFRAAARSAQSWALSPAGSRSLVSRNRTRHAGDLLNRNLGAITPKLERGLKPPSAPRTRPARSAPRHPTAPRSRSAPRAPSAAR